MISKPFEGEAIGVEEDNKSVSDSMVQAITLTSVTWELVSNGQAVRMSATGSDGRPYKAILPTNMHPSALRP